MTGILASLGGGLVATSIFIILWRLAESKVLKKQSEIALLNSKISELTKDLAVEHERLNVVAIDYRESEAKHLVEIARYKKTIDGLEGAFKAYQKRYLSGATPKSEAEGIGQLFPSIVEEEKPK